MRLRRALLLCLGLALGACTAAPTTTPDGPRPRPCDDGGSGGYVIDGVCL